MPLFGSRTTSVAWPASISCQVLAGVVAPPDAAVGAAQGGVDDHLAVGRELGIDDDLERRRADEGPVARRRLNRQQVAAGVDVGRAVEQVPGRAAVLGDQEADARRARVALAGGGDDDRLVRVVVPAEDGDAADVDAGGRAEVGQRDVGRAAGAGRQEVGRLPDAAAGAADVDRVARRVGRVDREAADPARARPTDVDAGPTAVQAWLDRALVGSSVKMRKLPLAWSLPGSPRPWSAAASGSSATSC